MYNKNTEIQGKFRKEKVYKNWQKQRLSTNWLGTTTVLFLTCYRHSSKIVIEPDFIASLTCYSYMAVAYMSVILTKYGGQPKQTW